MTNGTDFEGDFCEHCMGSLIFEKKMRLLFVFDGFLSFFVSVWGERELNQRRGNYVFL